MNRRQLLTAGLVGIASVFLPQNIFSKLPNNFIKPKPLNEGDIVGIIAPGTAVSDPDEIQKAIQVIQYFNLVPKIAPNLAKGSGYKSRTVAERTDDLHQMFTDKDIKAVFCIRGGYGSMQLLDHIDYDLIRNNPKIFVGFSDITALHLAINKFSGLITLHGPVLLSQFSDYTVNYYRKALFSAQPIGLISNPPALSGIISAYPVRTINNGVSTGKLSGGNLSLISSLMGTPYEIETEGKILFLEDVAEEPYKIDRMLSQLHLAKKLEKASGIIFGKCNDCERETSVWDFSLAEVLDRQLSNLGIPVLYGLLFGHTPEQVTLPYGIQGKLDANNGTLEILESSFD